MGRLMEEQKKRVAARGDGAGGALGASAANLANLDMKLAGVCLMARSVRLPIKCVASGITLEDVLTVCV